MMQVLLLPAHVLMVLTIQRLIQVSFGPPSLLVTCGKSIRLFLQEACKLQQYLSVTILIAILGQIVNYSSRASVWLHPTLGYAYRSHQLRSVFWFFSLCFLINSLFSGLSSQSSTASVRASLTFQSLSIFSATTALSNRLSSDGTYPLNSSLSAINLTLPFRLNVGTANSHSLNYAVKRLRGYA